MITDDRLVLESIAALRASVDALRITVEDVRKLVGPFGTAFPDGSMLVQTLYGTKYFIDPTDDIMAPQLIVYRQWEADLSKFMLNSVSAETTFVDIGANFGYFTCIVASRIGSTGKGFVIAVEPNPSMVRLFQRNIRINWSMSPIEFHPCAISDQNGYVEFNVPLGRAANAGLAIKNEQPNSGDSRFVVPTKTLPEVIGQRKIDLMKIDVEGFETLVLRHIGDVLVRSEDLGIVMEWSPSQMLAAGFSIDEFIGILASNNLSAFGIPPSFFVEPSALNGMVIPPEKLASMTYDNILLTRPR